MFEELDVAYRQRDLFLVHLRSFPSFESYRADCASNCCSQSESHVEDDGRLCTAVASFLARLRRNEKDGRLTEGQA
jgi:hypothetical protein